MNAAQAKNIIDFLVANATQNDQALCISVADSHGELVMFYKMDGCSQSSVNLAQAKAYTAARERQATINIGKWARENQRPVSYWADNHMTLFGGGVPVYFQDECIGGLGVSGLSEQDDHQLAERAAASLQR